MLIFTFIIEDQATEPDKDNSIGIDEDIFMRIGKNDMEAFDLLYKLTERTMYAFCISLTRDHQMSLDLVQDTYVKTCLQHIFINPWGSLLHGCLQLQKTFIIQACGKDQGI